MPKMLTDLQRQRHLYVSKIQQRIRTIVRKKTRKHIQVPVPDMPFPKLLLEADVIVELADDIDATGCGKKERRWSLFKLSM